MNELGIGSATCVASGEELDTVYVVDNEGGAAARVVFDVDGIGYETTTTELGSGINVDKLYGDTDSAVACTCGRSAPTVVAIKVSKSQTPQQRPCTYYYSSRRALTLHHHLHPPTAHSAPLLTNFPS